MNDLIQAIAVFAGNVATIRENYREENGFRFCSSMNASFEIPDGAKFARVFSTETQNDGSVRQSIYAFVALEDNETKGLGVVKAGDVMKPAGWKAPAKHARGNVFDESGGIATCTSYGPGYLR